MESPHSESTQALSAQRLSDAHQELQWMPLHLQSAPPENYSDVIDTHNQALDEFLAEQPSFWASVQIDSSPASVWPLSPLSVAGFSSHNAPPNNRAHFYHEPIKTFGHQLQYGGCPEIKQEPMVPMAMEWTPLSTEPYYLSHQHPCPIKCSSPTVYKDKLRTRQRGYEKVYRKKKRVEFKQMRREWIQLEMKHRMLRERMHSHSFAYVHQEKPSKLEALLQLQLEERALRQDLVFLQSLKAWYDVSMVRLPVDKEVVVLRTAHEWDTVSCCLLGVSTTAPFAPLKLTFSW